ncbi:lipopolysaccharide biosynthesis protein [Limosilactobacillus panis]|jgi:capsular polysaccharide biosynthesis protein|uniref:YveK family protein n=1 Tax=Limosilactobacillus panis TaxID=47493 RepID=UPI001C98A632|nr:Wzz/FepE/Etk N-terminal domain-containing protein [Limosilactobacillus panis]QZN92584.1 lipopolysaccharide biosynthesis protein [Limosilactobacillus panis]
MQDNKISIKNISKIVWHNIIVIAVATLVFGLIGGLYAKHKQHTDYVSTRSLMTSHSYRGNSANEEVQADINLGSTYAKIVKSDNVARTAHRSLPKKIRKDYSAKQISTIVKAHPVTQTTIVKVSAKAGTAEASSKIVNAVTDAAAKQIPKRVPSAGKISLFAKATADDAQSITTPSIKKFTLIGAAVGFLLGMVVAFSITTWVKLV